MPDEARPDARQFPSGFAELMGYRLTRWEDGRAEMALRLEPKHMNRNGVMHGGVLTTLIDTVCSYAGCYCTVPGHSRRCATMTLSAQFVAPARAGATLTATAWLLGGGRRIFFARCEIRDDAGTLVGAGEASFRYRRGSETPEGSPD